MQSSSISLFKKLSVTIDGADLVAASEEGALPKWAHLSVTTPSALEEVLRACSKAQAAVIAGPYKTLPQSIDRDCEYVFVEIKQMKQVLEHEPQDQVISVQTGITLQELNNYLAQFNQWFPATAPAQTSLLDLINRGDGGVLEHGFGAIRDLVLGLSVITGGGARIKTGGMVVKNVTGYDTTKLFVGSHASFGFAYTANLRLFAKPEKSAAVIFHNSDPFELLKIASDLIGADLSMVCCELIDLRRVRASSLLRESTLKAAQRWNEYGLLVRVAGPEPLLTELIPQIRSFKRDNTTNVEISNDDVENLIDVCTLQQFPRLELSASLSEMHTLLKGWWTANNAIPFQCRPAAGRMYFYPAKPDELDQLIESLCKLLRNAGAPNTVAVCKTELEYEVIYLGADIKKLSQIKASLKEQFDPSKCLNPLAVL